MSLQFEKLADSQAVWLEAAAPVCHSLGVSIWWAYSNVELQRRAQQLQEGRHFDVHHKLWFVHIYFSRYCLHFWIQGEQSGIVVSLFQAFS